MKKLIEKIEYVLLAAGIITAAIGIGVLAYFLDHVRFTIKL